MKRRHDCLPHGPLLDAYVAAGLPSRTQLAQVLGLGERFRVVLEAPRQILFESFLERASADDLQTALVRFYQAAVSPPLHAEQVRRRAGVLRHALGYLLRCPDPPALKMQNCLAADGPYHVAGLGPSFWSALLQGLNPSRHPAWTPAVEAGLRRLDLPGWQPHDSPERVYNGLIDLHTQLQHRAPSLSALHLEHFFGLVAEMDGCDLWSGAHRLSPGPPALDLAAAVRHERQYQPLRERLRLRGAALAQAQEMLQEGLRTQNGKLLGRALVEADPTGGGRANVPWKAGAEELCLWVGRLWEADDPFLILGDFWDRSPIAGAGLWLPAAVLHLREPQHFTLFNDRIRAGLARLDDSLNWGGPPADRYRLAGAAAGWLRQTLTLHPLETPALLEAVGTEESSDHALSGHFHGFGHDTFRFLHDLARNNASSWMERHRQRYRFVVQGPLTQLCRALAERYVEPILRGRHGWPLETRARKGLALTSICKNDFGRSDPYQTTLWIAFCRRPRKGKRDDLQFAVRLDPAGVFFGLRLGEGARAERETLTDQAERVVELLQARAAADDCRLGPSEGPLSAEALRAACCEAGDVLLGRFVPRESPLLRGDALVGEVLLTFDALVLLYALLTEPEKAEPAPATCFGPAEFQRHTFLDGDWLDKARRLLDLKRQLILQGVPGTGKTHVARCLARLLTGDDPEAVRLVQFHPAYSYEEFIEGIKVQSVERDGRHEVSYPVEPGLLCQFADQAARQPGRPHVLLIDEINRGNLPRIFGELLYLLEYREQVVTLPCSRRPFRLPANLYLLGTMNVADRSTAPLDQALRRRFSFLEMAPDAEVLRAWFEANPPDGGPALASAVVGLLERLNRRLRDELGGAHQVGHSYFMVPRLDHDRLNSVWDHQVRPLLQEWGTLGGRWTAVELEEFLQPARRGSRRREPAST